MLRPVLYYTYRRGGVAPADTEGTDMASLNVRDGAAGRTLAEINEVKRQIEANRSPESVAFWDRRDREWGFRKSSEIRVGRYGRAGKHTHIVTVETVSEILDPATAGPRVKLGQVRTVSPACNGNTGGTSGWFFAGLDTKDVTCSKCRKAYGLD